MVNVENVLDGWQNFIVKSEVTEKLAENRAKICAVCPFLEEKALLKVFVKDRFTEIQGTRCSICKCPTSAKIRSVNETCSDTPKRW